jgi:Tol biopolymer transport system component
LTDPRLKKVCFIDKSTGDRSWIQLTGQFSFIIDIDWSPLGSELLFTTLEQGGSAIWTVDTTGENLARAVDSATQAFAYPSARWSADGKAIYFWHQSANTADLMKLLVRPRSSAKRGQAHPLLVGVLTSGNFSVSSDARRLAYQQNVSASNLWLVKTSQESPEQPIEVNKITEGTAQIGTPAVSPDGKTIVYTAKMGKETHIYSVPIDGGTSRRLSYGSTQNRAPAWSPDGKYVAYLALTEGEYQLAIAGVVDSGYRVIEAADVSEIASEIIWSPGERILCPCGGIHLHYQEVDPITGDVSVFPYYDSTGAMAFAKYSPDGQRIAVFWGRGQSLEDSATTDVPGIWVLSTDGDSAALIMPVESAFGALCPLGWSEDGDWVYFWEMQKLAVKRVRIADRYVEEVISLTLDEVSFIAMSPDASAYVCVVASEQSDIWLVDGFDPEAD